MNNEIKYIQKRTRAMVDKFISCHLKWEMLEPLLKDEVLIKNVEKRKAGVGLNVLRLTLYLDHIHTLANTLCDRDHRTASLANILKILEKNETQIGLRNEYTTPNKCFISNPNSDLSKEGYERIIEKAQSRDKAILEQKFDELCLRTLTKGKKLLKSELLEKAYKVRSKVISHYEMKVENIEPHIVDIKDFNLTWYDGKNIFEISESIVLDVALLVTGTNYAIETYKTLHKEYSNLFWDAQREQKV